MIKPLNRDTAGVNAAPSPVTVLQFGEGNFLRAFIDWMIDILNDQTSFNGAVKIVQPIPKGKIDIINKQDGLYHVLLEGIKDGKTHTQRRLITAVRGGLNPYDDYAQYLKLGENPDLQFIISNTTEAGIAFDEGDTSARALPDSFPGKLTALLHHRYNHFDGDPEKAPVVIPCELIDRNGDKLKNYVLQYAGLWDTEEKFKTWIEEHCTFCNTLVDRIVPGYPAEKADEIKKGIGFDDNLIVKGEYFHLWVIEGPGRLQEKLPFKEAGLNVLFVDDLSPYRTRKVRILNGLHTSMVPVGYLNDNRTVKEAVGDKLTGPYLQKELFEEIIPTLDLPEKELKDFAGDVLDRFRNPFIKHELKDIALNSVSKYKVRVLPSLLQYYDINGELPARIVFALAALIRFYKGEWKGEPTPLNDSEEVIEFMRIAWEENDGRRTTEKVLGNEQFWDKNLNDVPGLTDKVAGYLALISDKGINAALQSLDN